LVWYVDLLSVVRYMVSFGKSRCGQSLEDEWESMVASYKEHHSELHTKLEFRARGKSYADWRKFFKR